MKRIFIHSCKMLLLLLLFCVAGANSALAQRLSITGTITDSKHQPVSAASVQIKGTKSGTTSDIDGKYAIKASTGEVLIFKSIGFDAKEVTVGSNNTINVTLTETESQLNEVVVIGYGAQKRANVTGSQATFKADNLNERAITRVDQALVGQMAGVTVKQTTGVPGKAFSVNVRGSGSISAGNEPLYVIDGFPLSVSAIGSGGSFSSGNPLDNINPNDIEDIQVLKDAAAAAIYGSRASNGVVLITTKKGKSGKAKINYSAYYGYNAAAKYLPMLNGDQWIDRATEMINAAYVLKYGAKGATASDDNATRQAMNGGAFSSAYMLDPRWAMPGHPGLQYIDWQKAIEQKGAMQNQALSASGGNEFVNYFISGNYANQDGFVKGLGYKAYSARANVEARIAKNLKLGLNIAPTYSISQDPGVEGKDNIFHQAISYSPIQEDTVGLYPNAFKNGQYTWGNSPNSPIAKLENKVGQTKKYRTLGSIFAEYEIIKGLTLRSSLNLDNVDNATNSYTPYTIAGNLASRTFDAAKNPNLTANTSGSYSTFKRQTFVNENTLTYNTTIHANHSLSILLGQSYNTDRLDQSSLSSVGGYTSSVIQTLNAAAAVTGSTSSTKSVLVSYFSRAQYAYKNKYLLSASLREDGSSRFGGNTKYGIFPSASVGWRIIQEDFMKKLPVMSDLKLRFSYGVNGNNSIADYGSISQIGSYGYVLGSPQALAIGQAPSNLPNPDIKWEKSQTYDVGLDFGFFSNRLTGSFDYYNKLNTDLLLNVPILQSTGFSSQLRNAGSVRNIGQELELTSRNLVGKVQWSTSINISHYKNKIVSLYGNQKQIIIPNSFDVSDAILRVGQPINSIYVVRQIGFLTQADLDNHVATYGTGETVGDPKYQDLNGDGVITEADKQIVGHPSPNYTWGITNTVRWKGFDLTVLVQGQNGGSVYSLLGRAITRTGQGFTDNAPAFYDNRWRSPENQGAGRVSKAYSTFGFVANTDWLYSSDYARVRNITLGYDLKNIFKTKVLGAARLYVTAENFFGHDKYYGGFNPEAQNTAISSDSNYPEAGDYGGLPLAKSLIFGLNVTF
ncbi:TonB-dependent receptor [Mucilaginibacter gossypii]|uniref:SusC/RagA family TonB-linked outer membrane protein n=1 Tax=Mucilaginibacter gossypii TaxID=551996 RepID=UPI000DCDCBDB|nr:MULTISPECIES: TonB-dependent receptor [Mucilaginibacter]QTE38178.1 TonB-dependent receptor [Mucilaginibacter gossypii]RAV60348.1 TonB-dependent receptor [Mucilaginibacter rubeus]